MEGEWFWRQKIVLLEFNVFSSFYYYFQNYAADDRVVLPLILGVTMTTVVVVILMCYLVKRKRMCRMCKKSTNNRNAFENVEAQAGEDHENLLKNENQSEEE